jgi:hypothetical protein
MLPPFTLLTVVRVEKPGEWEYLPVGGGGGRINQRLIVVRPTFLTPASLSDDTGAKPTKFASDRHFLSYGRSDATTRGLQVGQSE